MSITTNLQRLVDAKSDIADAITAKGGTVNSGDGFEEFPADIATIPSGGGVSDSRIIGSYKLSLRAAKCKSIPPPPRSFNQPVSISGSFAGPQYVWTDGYNIYCSYNGSNKVFDRAQMKWFDKTWYGLTNFDGRNIWSDKTNIYYSSGSTQYVLNRETSTWETKTWSGLTIFDGQNVFNIGDTIYHMNSTASAYSVSAYSLGSDNTTWSPTSFSVPSGSSGYKIYGKNIWSDGINTYYSGGYSPHWLLSSKTTFVNKTTWNYNIYGSSVWTDGMNIYAKNYNKYEFYKYVVYSNGTNWEQISMNADPDYIWTDGIDIYYLDYKLSINQ